MGTLTKTVGAAAAVAALSLSVPAAAATILLDRGGTASGSNGRIFTDGNVNVRVSAWSLDTSNNKIYSATLGVWADGLGVDNSSWNGSDNSHTVDNSGWRDFLLFQFDENVELDRAWFNTGWDGMNDTDATIGAGNTGVAYNSVLNLNGQNFSTLSGLNLYGSNSNGNGSQNRDINPSNLSGNYWLIGASFNNPDRNTDGFKLDKITYNAIPAVPEPGTWLMMILGFGVIGGVMRRRNVEVRSAAFAA